MKILRKKMFWLIFITLFLLFLLWFFKNVVLSIFGIFNPAPVKCVLVDNNITNSIIRKAVLGN